MGVRIEKIEFNAENYIAPEIVFHHADADGYCAAAASLYRYIHNNVATACPEYAICIECRYNNEEEIEAKFNEVIGDHQIGQITIVDFSFSKDMLLRMVSRFKDRPKLVWLDHHITAKDKMCDWINSNDNYTIDTIKYDANECGTSLAANLFLTEQKARHINPITSLVKDYDLWIHKYETSKPFIMAAGNHDYRVSDWIDMFDDIAFPTCLVVEGYALINQQVKHANKISHSKTDVRINIGNDRVAVINIPGEWVNVVSDELMNSLDYADAVISYSIKDIDGDVIVAMRAKESSSIDCSKIMKDMFNGGGHKNAAGGAVSSFEEFLKKIKELSAN